MLVEALEGSTHVNSNTQAWSYRLHGINDPATVENLRDNNVDALDARWAFNAGWDEPETVALSRSGLSGLDAAAARSAGCTTTSEAVRMKPESVSRAQAGFIDGFVNLARPSH